MALVSNQQHQHAYEDTSASDEGGCCGAEDDNQMEKIPVGQAPPYIRRGFIRKVYSILSVQLILTVMIAAPFHMYLSPDFVRNHMGLYYACMFGTLGLVLGMACCCKEAARTFPTNYGFLLAFTVMQSILLGFVVTLYKSESVLLAVLATALVFGALTAFACCTSTDFTGLGPYLMAGLSSLICFSFVISMCSMFMPIPHGVQMVYSGLGVVLFSFYIIYDTQLIVGGNHEVNFSVDDYCFAALNLYLDIVNMFLYILNLIGERR